MSTNDGDSQLVGLLLTSNGSDEGLGTDDVEGGNTEELLRVEDTGLFQDLGSDWDGRVDGVGDDEDVSLGGVLCDALDEALDNAGVDLEQVVTGHAGLS